MSYKLIVSDIDGTLIKSDLTLTDRTRTAISRVRARGLTFTLASGRGLVHMKSYLPMLGEDTPVITYNGSIIATAGGKMLYEKRLSAESARRILEIGRELSAEIAVWMDGRLFVDGLTDAVVKYQELTGERAALLRESNDLAGREVSKILWFGEPESVRRYIEILDSGPTEGFVYFTSHPAFLEFVDEDVSKGRALAQIGALLGIERSEIIAIGDGMNDLSMIEYAGLGIAMGNAPDRLKVAADIVAATNDEDGLARIIEEYMLG